MPKIYYKGCVHAYRMNHEPETWFCLVSMINLGYKENSPSLYGVGSPIGKKFGSKVGLLDLAKIAKYHEERLNRYRCTVIS